MKHLFLLEPNEKYQKSFKEYVQTYLDDIANYAEVRTSTFWLIHKEEVVGIVRIRHQEVESAGHISYDISPDCRNQGYGNRILKLALEEAAQ